MDAEAACTALLLLLASATACDNKPAEPPLPSFEENRSRLEAKLDTLTWVAYAPTHFDPTTALYPDEASIRQDLLALRTSPLAFSGVITYAADGTLDRIPGIAREVGFEGVIMGIWSPESREQREAAVRVASSVDAYCIGNEGLGITYTLAELRSAMDDLRQRTRKPVTTSEEIDDYENDRLVELGDFLLPNAHPFWHGSREPRQAAQWTLDAYESLRNRAQNKTVFFKEVGLPTAGDASASEANQALYYAELSRTSVRFAYFEAFDQPWKTHHPVEPHWGLFYPDRRPKAVVSQWSP